MGKSQRKILSQATIVITECAGHVVIIRSDNDGKSVAATMADALVKLGAAAMNEKLYPASDEKTPPPSMSPDAGKEQP